MRGLLARWRRRRPAIVYQSSWFNVEHHPKANAGWQIVVNFTRVNHTPLKMTVGDAEELAFGMLDGRAKAIARGAKR